MNRAKSPALRTLRLLSCFVLGAIFASSASFALTAVHFGPLCSALTNEIEVLQALPDLSSKERARLRTLNRANKVFGNPMLNNGKALRMLKNTLGRFPEYQVPLDMVATNLVTIYNNEYHFVGMLLPELPPSPEASAVAAQYNQLATTVIKLNATITAAKTSALYGSAKRRLDNLFFRANQALFVPFPSDLSPNSLEARIDNGSGPRDFKVSYASPSAELTEFQAIRSETGIQILLSAVDSTRGIVINIPNVQNGTFRYEIPAEASLVNRTDFNFFDVPPAATNTEATNGSIFVSTTANEVLGSFECSGPGFNITGGRFRINITPY